VPKGATKPDTNGNPICVDYAVASGCRYLAEIDSLRKELEAAKATDRMISRALEEEYLAGVADTDRAVCREAAKKGGAK
jgi:hypothetical protein